MRAERGNSWGHVMLAQPSPDLLSLNTATVRVQWTFAQMIEGCARHQIRSISPWRDQVAQLGLKETARRIRDSGLKVNSLCQGGMFPAPDRAGRLAAIEDNRRAVDEAIELGATCRVLVVGGLPKGPDGRPVIEGHRRRAADGARWTGRIVGVRTCIGHAVGYRTAAPNARGLTIPA